MKDLREIAVLSAGWPLTRAVKDADAVEQPVIQARDLNNVRLTTLSGLDRARLPRAADRCRVQAGDLVVLSRGIGSQVKTSIIELPASGAIVTSNVTLVRPRPDLLLGEALFAYLLSGAGQGELQRRSMGSTVRALTVEELGTIKVPIPDRPTQERIVALWRVTEKSYTEAIAAAEARRALGVALLDRIFGDMAATSHERGHG